MKMPLIILVILIFTFPCLYGQIKQDSNINQTNYKVCCKKRFEIKHKDSCLILKHIKLDSTFILSFDSIDYVEYVKKEIINSKNDLNYRDSITLNKLCALIKFDTIMISHEFKYFICRCLEGKIYAKLFNLQTNRYCEEIIREKVTRQWTMSYDYFSRKDHLFIFSRLIRHYLPQF